MLEFRSTKPPSARRTAVRTCPRIAWPVEMGCPAKHRQPKTNRPRSRYRSACDPERCRGTLLDHLGEARPAPGTLRVEIDRLRTNPVLLPSRAVHPPAHTLGISGTARINALRDLAKVARAGPALSSRRRVPADRRQAELMYRATTTLDAMLAEVAELVMPLPVPGWQSSSTPCSACRVRRATLPDEDHGARATVDGYRQFTGTPSTSPHRQVPCFTTNSTTSCCRFS